MEVSRKTWLIILVASVLGLTGCGGEELESTQSIPVSLPIRAEVILREGESKSGRLTNIDRENKQIEITLGNISESVKLAQIKKVRFKPDATISTVKNLEPIRGKNKSSANKQETWMGIPLSNFQLENPRTGEAKVDLTKSSLDKSKQKGIAAVAQDSKFVAKEMQFDTSDKITLKVTW